MKKTLAIMVALGAFGIGANAQVLNFEDLNNNGTGGYTLFGDQFDSGGYHFASVYFQGNSAALASWTPDLPQYYTGSVSPFVNYFGDHVLMTKNGGGFFDVFSIDICDVFRTPGMNTTVTFVGTHADNSTTTKYVTLNGSENLKTYALNLTNLKSLEWDTGDINWVQWDNINLVPEPATMTALALGALALVRKRRKA
jgi:hypothetical protein